MARVLIIGCGCRGQLLAKRLLVTGHAVRGTTRRNETAAAITAAGAEPYIGDPDRIASLMEGLVGVTIVCWLLATATGEPAAVGALHNERLRMLCEKLVDTPVRGLVYEANGKLPAPIFDQGRVIVTAAQTRWRLPVQILETPPDDHQAWSTAALAAIEDLLRG